MNKLTGEYLVGEWSELLDRFPPQTMSHILRLAEANLDELATNFYEHMLQDPVASQFLTHEQVKTRLHGSMKAWIVRLFQIGPESEMPAFIAQQAKVGEVHARIDLPVHLVLRGAGNLKDTMLRAIQADSDHDGVRKLQVAHLMSIMIDYAMEIMSQVYSSAHDRNARAEESYRLFSVAQNISTEKERQRAALLDWENEVMFNHAVGLNGIDLPRIGASEFGLWFRHKGAHAFQGSEESQMILDAINQIDDVQLPAFAASVQVKNDPMRQLRDLREKTRSIGFHLERLFEQHSELEAGRDVLTRLLSRKFLPAVLGKEVNYARTSGAMFALLAIDIDHFKNINDTHGHEAGDLVLQQFAAVLTNTSRGGDYVFRLGGEEFLMLLVDVDTNSALRVAEKLRRQIASEVFRAPMDKTLKVTVSIGLALHGGHPDYQHTMRRADTALYQAKNNGRNQVVAA